MSAKGSRSRQASWYDRWILAPLENTRLAMGGTPRHAQHRYQAIDTDPWRAENFPPWLISMIFHLILLILLALISSGKAGAPGGGGGMTLSLESGGDGTEAGGMLDGGDVLEALNNETVLAQSFENSSFAESQATDLLADAGTLVSDLSPIVPSSNAANQIGSDSSGLYGSLPGLAEGSGTGLGLGDGIAQTSLFGVSGTGNRFVYVFDRSASMDFIHYGSEGNQRPEPPLIAAKRQLLESFDDLNNNNWFQLIIYNHQTGVFDMGPTSSKGLIKATPVNRQRAKSFVANMQADGSTSHFPALLLGLQMEPDVIFFLTDGEAQDDLTGNQISQLRGINRKKSIINVIHFGVAGRADSSLVQLARATGGKYLFIDVARLGSKTGGVLSQATHEAQNQPLARPN